MVKLSKVLKGINSSKTLIEAIDYLEENGDYGFYVQYVSPKLEDIYDILLVDYQATGSESYKHMNHISDVVDFILSVATYDYHTVNDNFTGIERIERLGKIKVLEEIKKLVVSWEG